MAASESGNGKTRLPALVQGFRLMILMCWLNPDVRPSKTRAA